MGGEVRLTEDQIAQLAQQITAQQKHVACRFSEMEAAGLHYFAGTMTNGGREKWDAILDFGATLIQIKKAGAVTLVTCIVAGLVGALWMGVKQKLLGG